MKSTFCLACLFIGLLPQLSFSQNQIIDSLFVLLNHSKEDTVRIDLLNELGWEFYSVDLDRSANFASQALHLSDSLDYLAGKSRAYNIMAIEKSIRGQNQVGFELNQKAYAIAKQINNPKLKSVALNDMAIYHSEIGNSAQALEYHQESLKFAIEMKDTLGICISLTNISVTHFQLDNLKESSKYDKQCSDYYSTSNDPKVKTLALISMGHMHTDQKNYTTARKKYEEALKLSKEQRDEYSQINMYQAIGHTYTEEGKVEIALNNCFKALTIAQNSNRMIDQVYLFDQLSYIFKKQEQYNKGIESAQKGLQLAQEIGLLEMQHVFYNLLAELHDKQSNYELAFQHLKQANEIKDSLKTTEQEKQALALEAQFQSERKEMENKLLREEASKKEAILRKRKTEIYVTILGFLSASIIATLLYFAYLGKKRFNENLKKVVEERTRDLEHSVAQLEKSNSELESFAYIASHDLKEPIRNISSFTKLAIRELENDEKKTIKDYLDFVAENAVQMHTLVEDVLEYSKIGHSKEAVIELDLNEMIEKVKLGLKTRINDRKAIITYEQLPKLRASPTPIFILLKNLIENGLKYNESQPPIIAIKWEKINEDWQRITISDNGIGIEPEYQNKIFEMFKRLHTRSVYKGSGLGLAICKKIVSNLNGELSMESTLGLGSHFFISLPIVESPKVAQVAAKKVEMA